MRLLLKLIVFVIALALIMMPILASGQATDAPNFSAESDSVVVLSNSEADSLLDLIDDQTLHVRLLEADLWEARELARSDSVLASEQLKLQEHYYEQIIQAYRDDQDTWVERIVKQPLIWFGLGVWLAGQAQ
jgi:hypothetical protein